MQNLFEVKTTIHSCFIHATNDKLHDVNILDIIQYEFSSFYIADKAYIDFERLCILHKQRAYYVTRAKDNIRFKRKCSEPVNKIDRSVS
jgi:hypothetical protein